jgi:hypothetical protein
MRGTTHRPRDARLPASREAGACQSPPRGAQREERTEAG